jgi:hypothetical protein
MRHDLMLNEYLKEFVDSVMKLSRSSRPSSGKIHQGTIRILYVRVSPRNSDALETVSISGPFYKTKHTLRGALMKTVPVGDAQQMKQCVYSIPCDCDRCYTGETSRHLEVCIKEHKHNMTQGLLAKSKLIQHAHEESHKIRWNEAKVLQTERNTTYRKHKESARMSLIDHPINRAWTSLPSGLPLSQQK